MPRLEGGGKRNRVGAHTRIIFLEIAEHHGFEIKELEVDKNHVQVFLSVPPKYAIVRQERRANGVYQESKSLGNRRATTPGSVSICLVCFVLGTRHTG